MIHKAAERFSLYLVREAVVDADDQEICAFGLECCLSTLTQILLITIIALWLGIFAQAGAVFLCFAGLKKWIGGYHANSQLVCLISSTIVVIGPAWLSANVLPATALTGIAISAQALVWLLIILCRAPILHENNPKTPTQRLVARNQAWRMAGLQSLLVLAGVWLLPEGFWQTVVSAGSLGSVGAALTLLLPNKPL